MEICLIKLATNKWKNLQSEMKMENKYNRTIRKEDLDTGME